MEKFSVSPKDTLVCYDAVVPLRITGNQSQTKSITWNIPGTGMSTEFKAAKDQKVVVLVTDQNNCSILDTAIIRVKACSSPDKCLVIATAFTPNNDGLHESVGPVTNACRIENLNFKIYNRWGKIVFQSSRLESKWNGRLNGIDQASGNYVFQCTYTTDDRVQRMQSGTILLIR